MQQEKFECWAIIELFGHNKIAGRVTEQTIGGSSMVRVDVPETKASPPFTRLLNVSAIYAINPVTEEVARACADRINSKPIEVWDARQVIKRIDEQLKLNEASTNEPSPEYEFGMRQAEKDLEEPHEEEGEEEIV